MRRTSSGVPRVAPDGTRRADEEDDDDEPLRRRTAGMSRRGHIGIFEYVRRCRRRRRRRRRSALGTDGLLTTRAGCSFHFQKLAQLPPKRDSPEPAGAPAPPICYLGRNLEEGTYG